MERFSGAAGFLEINSFLTSSAFLERCPLETRPHWEWCRKLFIAIPSLKGWCHQSPVLIYIYSILQFKYIIVINHIYIYTGITNQSSSGAGFQPSKDFAPSQTGTLVENPAEFFMSRTQFSDDLLGAGTQPQANQQQQSQQDGLLIHHQPTKQPTNHDKHHNMPRFWNPILYITCSQVHQNKLKLKHTKISTHFTIPKKTSQPLFCSIGMALFVCQPLALWWARNLHEKSYRKKLLWHTVDGSEIRRTSWYGSLSHHL